MTVNLNQLKCFRTLAQCEHYTRAAEELNMTQSSLSRMIAGLELPTTGNIYIGDRLVNDVLPKDRDIAMVFQNYALYPHMSVYENIAFGAEAPTEEEVLEAAKIAHADEFIREMPQGYNTPIGERGVRLSGGQKQRIAIARAIVKNPRIILADEPTGNLDYNTSVEIMELFVKLKKNNNQSMIVVTHDPMVAAYADRVMFLHDGSKVAEHINSDSEDNYSSIIDIFRNINTMN
mgnify:CR=1 FL=1